MLETVIGLEIHLQLNTRTKMFCGCNAHETGAGPNRHVCPICLGHPGVLPVPNEEAIRKGVQMGLALGCTIADHSKFDRKNYFYPDLPKSYQISQFDLPICLGGSVEIDVPGNDRPHVTIGITRAHLEEDAAKNLHGESGKTYVDFNRGGTPLLEIVTEPDFRSPAEAKAFLQELRRIARYLGVSEADMEKGHMRCDANISLRERDDKTGDIIGLEFHPKTEVKNVNSFRFVERALEYEIKRQTKLWKTGTPPSESTTRGWNDVKQKTEVQRTKEDAADYRYFPEPDIPPLALSELAEELRLSLPELPRAKRERFVREYCLKPVHAEELCDDPAVADFTEHVFSELRAWLDSVPGIDLSDPDTCNLEYQKLGKLVSTWVITKLGGVLSANKSDVRIMKITAENFAELLTMIALRKLNNQTALKVLEIMYETGEDPHHIMEEQDLGSIEDDGVLEQAIQNVLASHPDEVSRYKAGEVKLSKFFLGQVMKETRGKADPTSAAEALENALASL